MVPLVRVDNNNGDGSIDGAITRTSEQEWSEEEEKEHDETEYEHGEYEHDEQDEHGKYEHGEDDKIKTKMGRNVMMMIRDDDDEEYDILHQYYNHDKDMEDSNKNRTMDRNRNQNRTMERGCFLVKLQKDY